MLRVLLCSSQNWTCFVCKLYMAIEFYKKETGRVRTVARNFDVLCGTFYPFKILHYVAVLLYRVNCSVTVI